MAVFGYRSLQIGHSTVEEVAAETEAAPEPTTRFAAGSELLGRPFGSSLSGGRFTYK